MPLQKDKAQIIKYVYNFATDGGAVGAIPLRPYVSGVQLAEGMYITNAKLWIEAALTSGGSATVTVGNTSDPDGFWVDMFALGALNAMIDVGEVDGALLWNTTTDSNISFRVTSASNTQDVSITVGTAALTAGRMVLELEVLNPSSAVAS